MCLSVLAVRLWRMRTSLRRWLRRLAWRRRRWNACGEWERRGWGIADDDQYAEPEKKIINFVRVTMRRHQKAALPFVGSRRRCLRMRILCGSVFASWQSPPNGRMLGAERGEERDREEKKKPKRLAGFEP